jgi:hypothetical protein
MNDNLEVPPDLATILEGIDSVARTARGTTVSDLLRDHVADAMRLASLSLVAVTGLPQCQLGHPHSTIKTGYDPSGNLRLECLHSPQHCWSLTGIKTTC